MKKLSVLAALVLTIVMAMGLVACSSYGSLKKAFEKEGYAESQTLENIANTIKTEAEEDNLAITIHAMSKGLNVAVIVEFNSTEDMKKLYDESATIQGFVKDISSNEDAKAFQKALEDAGYAKGNCLVVPVNPLSINEITNIVKGA